MYYDFEKKEMNIFDIIEDISVQAEKDNLFNASIVIHILKENVMIHKSKSVRKYLN